MTARAQLQLGRSSPTKFDLPSGSVAALQAGSADALPVLLVPGFTGSKEDFGPLFDPLAGAGFSVTAIDLPGQFESSAAHPDEPSGYTPAGLAETVRGVAAQLGTRVHLLGHSFGGLVARAAVIAAPSSFASLVLMDSGPAAIGGARRRRIEALAPLLPSAGVAGVFAASQAAAAAEPGYIAPAPELAAFLQRRFLASSAAMLQGMGAALCCEPDLTPELGATGVATLVLYGENDDAWAPAEQAEMARRLAAEQVVISGAAHSPAVENPSATATALIGFWRERSLIA
jgi:pimeloyl-ACP methyl ester carboxylesterase